jgi:hypothetical protein
VNTPYNKQVEVNEKPVKSIEPAFGFNVAPTNQAQYWQQLVGFQALSFLLVLANHVILTPPQLSFGWWLFALKTLMD